jgi:hypothetical protein
MCVRGEQPHLLSGLLHHATELRPRPVGAFSAFRLRVRQRVDLGFRHAHPLCPISGDDVTDDESSRVLLAVDGVRSVVVDGVMADSAREALTNPVLTVAFVVG